MAAPAYACAESFQADLRVYQGDTYNGAAEITNADGTPAVLTGYTAAAQIRADVADTAAAVVTDIVTLIVNNMVNLSIPPAVTQSMRGYYVWDLELTAPDTTVTTVLYGRVIVIPDVTRS